MVYVDLVNVAFTPTPIIKTHKVRNGDEKIMTIDCRFMVGFRNGILSNPFQDVHYKDCQNPRLGFMVNTKVGCSNTKRIAENPSK